METVLLRLPQDFKMIQIWTRRADFK